MRPRGLHFDERVAVSPALHVAGPGAGLYHRLLCHRFDVNVLMEMSGLFHTFTVIFYFARGSV